MFISAFKINKIIECIVYLSPPEDISRWCVWNGWCHFFKRMSYRYANAIFLQCPYFLHIYASQVASVELHPGHNIPESNMPSISSSISSSEGPRTPFGRGPSGTVINSVVRITSMSVSSRISGSINPLSFSTQVRPFPMKPGLQAHDHLDQSSYSFFWVSTQLALGPHNSGLFRQS